MITLRDLQLQRQGSVLFEQASLQIHDGQHVGLIGKNGSGKSSLFQAMLGELPADKGDISLPKDWPIATMSQHIIEQQMRAIDYVLAGNAQLFDTLCAINEAEQLNQQAELANLHNQLESLDGYAANSRAEKLLAGLGFKPEDSHKAVSEFSGGWQMRLNLARCLFQPSRLMLLDEPTNHLDLDATLWLQDWLKQYPGTLVLISHDREFLDAICQQILFLHQQQLKLYKGNYSSFERQRAEQLSQQQAAFEKQQERRKHLESFINRFKAKATKSRQAQSRIKALEKMPDIAPAHIDSPFAFSFPEPESLPSPLLKLDHAELGYGQATIIGQASLHLLPGQRIGLLGPNGAGKSTLIKALAGESALLSGERFAHEKLRIGYFAQQQLQQLRLDESALWHLQQLSPDARHQDLLDFLGSFAFNGERCDDKVSQFSGGEQARLVLALIIWQKPNLLLLDEPTNHLDLQMRFALTEALQGFEGAMLLVSHDRYLLQNTVDDFYLVANRRLERFDGSLEDYAEFLRQHRRDDKPAKDNADSEPGLSKKELRQKAAEKRQKLAPLSKEIKSLEKQIQQLENELAAIENALADPDIYNEDRKTELQKWLAKQAEIQPALAQHEERWLELNEQLELLQTEQ